MGRPPRLAPPAASRSTASAAMLSATAIRKTALANAASTSARAAPQVLAPTRWRHHQPPPLPGLPPQLSSSSLSMAAAAASSPAVAAAAAVAAADRRSVSTSEPRCTESTTSARLPDRMPTVSSVRQRQVERVVMPSRRCVRVRPIVGWGPHRGRNTRRRGRRGKGKSEGPAGWRRRSRTVTPADRGRAPRLPRRLTPTAQLTVPAAARRRRSCPPPS